jgi:hypothetical protein
MNAIAKVLAPAALVLASFSANAGGLIEIDYPLDRATATHTTAQVRDTGPSFSGLDIHYPGPTVSGDQTRSRADVVSEARDSGSVGTTRPFAGHNA